MKFKTEHHFNESNDIFKRHGCLPLTEKNLNRISHGHNDSGYAIISGSREENRYVDSDVNGTLKFNPDELNNIRTKQLKNIIYQYGYTFVPVYGGYREMNSNEFSAEKSFIVYPYKRNGELIAWDEFTDDVIDIVMSTDDEGHLLFNQDSILFKAPNKPPVYVDPKGIEEPFYPGDNLIQNDTSQDYYTSLKRWKDISLNKNNSSFDKGKPQRFTYSEAYITAQPQTIHSAGARQAIGECVALGFKGYDR